jgi:hypothetical protein
MTDEVYALRRIAGRPALFALYGFVRTDDTFTVTDYTVLAATGIDWFGDSLPDLHHPNPVADWQFCTDLKACAALMAQVIM